MPRWWGASSGGRGSSGLGVPARGRLGVAMEKGAGTRRRRLVERGSDRLAFITGQTRSLSCDPIPGNADGKASANPRIAFCPAALADSSRVSIQI